MQPLIAAVLILFVCTAPAGAQSLDRLKLSVGDRVDVTERTGVITTGVLTDVTDTTVQAGNRDFPIDSVLKVDRRGDSIWSGLIIGAGFGLLLSPIAQEGCLHGSNGPCIVMPMLVYGGVGALIDLAHEGKTTIYRAAATGRRGARISPMFAPGVKAISLGVGF